MNPYLFQARILQAKRSLLLQAIRYYTWKRKRRRFLKTVLRLVSFEPLPACEKSTKNILNVKLAKRAFVVVCLSSDSRLIRSCTGIRDEITVRSEFPVPNAVNIGQNIKSF